jgi:predicted nucleic acid-binding Zn ribbon protein
MAHKGPQPIGTVITDVIEKMGIKQKLDEVRAIEAWAALAGPQINAVTDSAFMKGGKLYVRLTSSVWRQELHMRRRDWRDRLNDQLGSRFVTEIVFR